MLAQLVRPLVRTQVQLLSQCPSAGAKLVGMVSQWLGYLGIQAEVTQLHSLGDRIQVSLQVGKPEQCTEAEWQSILANLNQSEGSETTTPTLSYSAMDEAQQRLVQRLLAAVLQASCPDPLQEWPTLRPQLLASGLEEPVLLGIQAALKVPMPIEHLVERIDPEVVPLVLSKAIAIALLDRQVNAAEDRALNTLLNALNREIIVDASPVL